MSFTSNYEPGYPSMFDEVFVCKPSEECESCTYVCEHNPNEKYKPLI